MTYEAIRQGVSSFGRMTPISGNAAGLAPGTNGLSMRSFCPSMASALPCGARSRRRQRTRYPPASRRNNKAAKKFFRQLLKGVQDVPRGIVTDKLKSYGAAQRERLPGVEHRQSRYLNNRCAHSHRPPRQRERRMQGLKSAGRAQRFLSAYGPIAQHFRPRRHLLSASESRAEMRHRFESWAAMTGTERAT